MKICGNISFYNVNKTMRFFVNNNLKEIFEGNYSKSSLITFFTNLGCFDYINNRLVINKITNIRFYNSIDKNLFFLLAGFNNIINDNDLIFNFENEIAQFDILVDNNILILVKIFNGNNLVFSDIIEFGTFKHSLIYEIPLQNNILNVIKFYNIYTNEEIKSNNAYKLY